MIERLFIVLFLQDDIYFQAVYACESQVEWHVYCYAVRLLRTIVYN